ncbi:MAG: hypothetical protein ACRD5Z_09095, partial [Bryobacteraceae bacterium]
MKITRRQFGAAASLSMLAAGEPGGLGVWPLRFGTPEKITPSATRRYPAALDALRKLPVVSQCPLSAALISARATSRGYEVSL